MQDHISSSRDGQLSKLLRPGQKVHVALVGEFGPNHVSPRQLLSSFINQVVEVYGIVTKVDKKGRSLSPVMMCTIPTPGVGSAS